MKSQFTELCVIHWMYTKITVFARRFERIKWRTIYTYYVHGEIKKEKRHTRHMVACVSIDQQIHTISFGESYAFSLTVQMCKVFLLLLLSHCCFVVHIIHKLQIFVTLFCLFRECHLCLRDLFRFHFLLLCLLTTTGYILL